MRLLAIHSIYSEAGHHPPGSEFSLEDKQEAARLIELKAAQHLDEPAETVVVEPAEALVGKSLEADLPTQKAKKGSNAKS